MHPYIDFIVLSLILIVNVFILLSFMGFFWSAAHGAPFVPTGKKTARQMIALAEIKPGEKVFDLGCGDGRLVFLAGKEGADAVGVEISHLVYLWSRFLQKIHNYPGTLIRGSMWDIDVSEADVIFTYLLPEMMTLFYEKIYPQLPEGCRIVTHAFRLKKLEPVQVWHPPNKHRGKIYVYQK